MKRAICAISGAFLASGAALAAPTLEQWTTTQGARVLFVAAPEIPMLDVRVVFAAGSARDDGAAGLANLTSSLLEEGAGELDADAFSQHLAATGAIMHVGAERDMAYASLRTMVEVAYADPALALFTSALSAPRFDAAALARRKAQILLALEQRTQSPDALADDTFFAYCFPDHPYGAPADGTRASVSALDRGAVKAFHARYYVAQNAVIALVGALDRKQAEALADRIAAELAPGERAHELPPVATARGREHHVAFPSVQSHVRIGLPGISRKDPDYFALVVGNHALGGNSMASILFDEVRNQRGLSYSVSSYFVPMAQQGPFIAALQTSGERQDEALRVLRDTLLEFVSSGPPPAAIARAKQNLIDGFPLRVASNAQLVEYIAMIGFYDLPQDYLATFPERVAAVTPQAVKDAFARRVLIDHLTTVVVGRAPPDSP